MFCYGSISSFRNFLCKDKSQSYSSHAKWMNAQHYNSPFPPSQFPLCSFPRHNVYRCVWLAYPAKRQGRYTAAGASPYIRKSRPAQEACIPLYFQHRCRLTTKLCSVTPDTAESIPGTKTRHRAVFGGHKQPPHPRDASPSAGKVPAPGYWYPIPSAWDLDVPAAFCGQNPAFCCQCRVLWILPSQTDG